MNSVERVKEICKERKIPISKLEKDLGWEDAGTMHKIYEHISDSDRIKQENKIAQFFSSV